MMIIEIEHVLLRTVYVGAACFCFATSHNSLRMVHYWSSG
jgi:hypothetical protein